MINAPHISNVDQCASAWHVLPVDPRTFSSILFGGMDTMAIDTSQLQVAAGDFVIFSEQINGQPTGRSLTRLAMIISTADIVNDGKKGESVSPVTFGVV